MITSNSTYEEIERQKALDEKNIRDFLANTFSRDGNKIKRILRVKTYYTPTKPATFHSHTTNIHWRILAQGGLSVAGGCRCLTKDGNTSIEKEGYIPYPLQA